MRSKRRSTESSPFGGSFLSYCQNSRTFMAKSRPHSFFLTRVTVPNEPLPMTRTKVKSLMPTYSERRSLVFVGTPEATEELEGKVNAIKVTIEKYIKHILVSIALPSWIYGIGQLSLHRILTCSKRLSLNYASSRFSLSPASPV